MQGFARKLIADQRGANAIEYGLLGAFLGIGLLAALVGTRTSVTGTFTAIGSKISTGVNGPAVDPSSVPASYAGKTLAGRLISTDYAGRTVYTYSYSDGSKATYTQALASNPSFYPASLRLNFADKSIMTYNPPAYDTAGNMTTLASYFVTTVYADGYSKTAVTYNTDTNGQTASGTQYTYQDQYGGGTPTAATVTAQVSSFQALVNQYAAYAANP